MKSEDSVDSALLYTLSEEQSFSFVIDLNFSKHCKLFIFQTFVNWSNFVLYNKPKKKGIFQKFDLVVISV